MRIQAPDLARTAESALVISVDESLLSPDLGIQIFHLLGVEQLLPYVVMDFGYDAHGGYLRLQLQEAQMALIAPGFDTLQVQSWLRASLTDLHNPIVYEVFLAMLLCPFAMLFPSVDELYSAIRVRCDIVNIAGKSALSFDTHEATRPVKYWQYDEDVGFIIRPNVLLSTALESALYSTHKTKPYAFSCYRATEYVLLLALVHELYSSNLALLCDLQSLWAKKPIKSGKFHEVFLQEYGSMEKPLPPRYFIPGDRVWFRNPDMLSADIAGYEGSWVLYLGNGLFSNFWKRGVPYTLVSKCVEIFHWRNAISEDANALPCIDEKKVDSLVKASLSDPIEIEHIMTIMARYREARGVYTHAGGCLDTTRECLRWLRPHLTDICLAKG